MLMWLRSRAVVAAHLVLYVLAYLIPYMLRFEFRVPAQYQELFLGTAAFVVLTKLVTFYAFGEFRAALRYVGIADLKRIAMAASVASLIAVGIEKLAALRPTVPRSVQLMDWVLTFLLISGMRVALRVFRERGWRGAIQNGGRRVLIAGAGDAGEGLLREFQRRPELGVSVVGFLDDNPGKLGRTLGGVRVLGAVKDAEAVSRRTAAAEAIIAMPSATKDETRAAVHELRKARLAFRTLPHMVRAVSCRVDASQVSDVTIGEILGREPVEIDLGRVEGLLRGKRVMVTGAAGSIGSEICRQVLAFAPESLAALDWSENGLFYLERELRRDRRGDAVRCFVADIRDRARVGQILADSPADVVFHAAAHKHVPVMEANPCEAVKNNVTGTRTVAELAVEHGVGRFVLISTDKAANPTGVMGMTKRVAEMLVRAMGVRRGAGLVAVRFGNVLDSSGSVVRIFKDQIRAGGPVTVTHAEMTRFFMTIPEAVQLVLAASTAGAPGQIMVLDMGEPVKILDLARELIGLAGLREPEDIRIEFIGLRPGERLHEALSGDGETLAPSSHEGVLVASGPMPDYDILRGQLAELERAADSGDEDGVRRLLRAMTAAPATAAVAESVAHPGSE